MHTYLAVHQNSLTLVSRALSYVHSVVSYIIYYAQVTCLTQYRGGFVNLIKFHRRPEGGQAWDYVL